MGTDISLEIYDNLRILNEEPMKETIVLVDDNEDQLIVYKFLLNLENPFHNILTFNSAEKALDYIKTNRKSESKYNSELYNENSSISMIISDYNMFPKNGLDFYREIKKSGISIPFILFSSFISEKIRSEAQKIGINKCIDKNIDVNETIRELSSIFPHK